MKKATIYFNMKTGEGIETVDELSTEDFENYYTFNREVRYLTEEYRLAGMDVYLSQRACKSWKEVVE